MFECGSLSGIGIWLARDSSLLCPVLCGKLSLRNLVVIGSPIEFDHIARPLLARHGPHVKITRREDRALRPDLFKVHGARPPRPRIMVLNRDAK